MVARFTLSAGIAVPSCMAGTSCQVPPPGIYPAPILGARLVYQLWTPRDPGEINSGVSHNPNLYRRPRRAFPMPVPPRILVVAVSLLLYLATAGLGLAPRGCHWVLGWKGLEAGVAVHKLNPVSFRSHIRLLADTPLGRLRAHRLRQGKPFSSRRGGRAFILPLLAIRHRRRRLIRLPLGKQRS